MPHATTLRFGCLAKMNDVALAIQEVLRVVDMSGVVVNKVL